MSAAARHCKLESRSGINEQEKFLQFVATLNVQQNFVPIIRNPTNVSGFDQLEALCALLDERQKRIGEAPDASNIELTSHEKNKASRSGDDHGKEESPSRSGLPRRHSLASLEHQPDNEKNRKEKSPWGKVKNIISTRRDSSRKRSCPQDSWRMKTYSGIKERNARFSFTDEYVGQMPMENKKDNLEVSISNYDHLLLSPMDLQFSEESQSLPGSPNRVSSVFFYDDQLFDQAITDQVMGNPKCPVGTKIRARPLAEKKPQEEDLKPEFRLKVAEWEVRKALAGLGTTNIEEIRKLMPDDFNKKLQQWETKKQASCGVVLGETRAKSTLRSTKNSNKKGGNETKKTCHDLDGDEDLPWIERELRKIQREQENLDLDRAKLQKMRHAIKKPEPWREITVKTSTGEEFRFGGISEKFTRKLYEWEQRKKIPLECSSIALLGSGSACKIINDSNTLSSQGIPRSKSDGSLVENCIAKAAEETEPNNRLESDHSAIPNHSKCHSRFSIDNGEVENLCHFPLLIATAKNQTKPTTISREYLHRLQYSLKNVLEEIDCILAQKLTCKIVTVQPTFFESIGQLVTDLKLATEINDLEKGEMPWQTCDIVSRWSKKTLPSMLKGLDDLDEKGSQVSLSRYGSESILNSKGVMTEMATVDVAMKDFVRMRIPRQASSDDLSTPNSCRSRSSSIISSDFIPEECEEDCNIVETNCQKQEKDDVDIEKVCQLVEDLKEQDLFFHRQRIAEKSLISGTSQCRIGEKTDSVPSPHECGIGIVPTVTRIFSQSDTSATWADFKSSSSNVSGQLRKEKSELEMQNEINNMRQKHQMARESFFGGMMQGDDKIDRGHTFDHTQTSTTERSNIVGSKRSDISGDFLLQHQGEPMQGSSSCPTTPIQMRK